MGLSATHKANISKALKGRMPKNIDQIKGYWSGKKFPKELRDKLSKAHMGVKLSLKHRESLRSAQLGHATTDETRKKISEAHLKSGHKPVNCERRGKDSHAWKGGKTSAHKIVRMSKKYRQWRKHIFERDNYTCLSCGLRGRELQVDHIKPFAFFPELRFSDENARTLCLSCHKKTPTYARNSYAKPL